MATFQQAPNNNPQQGKAPTPNSKEHGQNTANRLVTSSLILASFSGIAKAEDGPKIEPKSNTQNNVQVENNTPQIVIPSLPSTENLPTYESVREDYRKALSESTSREHAKNDLNKTDKKSSVSNANQLKDEQVINVNSHLTVGIDKSKNNFISSVKIKTDNFERTINGYLGKDGDPYYVDDNGVRVHGLIVRKDGNVVYKTVDENGRYMKHRLTSDGKYSEGLVGMDIAQIQPIVFTEFRTEQGSVTNTHVSTELMRKTIKEGMVIAKNEHRMPVIYSGYHGSRGWNRGTGDDSQFIKLVGEVAKEVGYDGSVGILFMHCFSGALEKERAACEKYLNVGSCVLKTSKPVSYTYYNPNTIQSAKPKERDESSFIISGIHLGSNIIVESNDVNGIVVTNEGAKLYTESGNKNSSDLPNLNKAQLEDYLYNELYLPEKSIKSILNSGNCQAYLRIMLKASQEFEKSSSYNGWYKPIGFDYN